MQYLSPVSEPPHTHIPLSLCTPGEGGVVNHLPCLAAVHLGCLCVTYSQACLLAQLHVRFSSLMHCFLFRCVLSFLAGQCSMSAPLDSVLVPSSACFQSPLPALTCAAFGHNFTTHLNQWHVAKRQNTAPVCVLCLFLCSLWVHPTWSLLSCACHQVILQLW